MTRAATAPARALSFAMRDPRAVVAVAAVYLAFGLVFLFTDRSLNDEGLVTVVWASAARHEPLAVLFFQKAKPVLALLYLPAAVLGTRAALAAHLVVASAAIPLLGATARALRLQLPNLAPLVAALSPVYFVGGAAGLSNVDGVVGTSLALYLLLARKKTAWAGLVLGLLPWVRHELAFLVAVLVLRAAIVDRSRALVLGALAFPVLYGVAGAAYNRDALWMLHYPPTTLYPMPNNPVWEPVSVAQLVDNLLAVTPAVALCALARPRRLTPIECTLFAWAAGWLLMCTVLPIFRLANFGFSPRYALQVLPVVALLSARAPEPWLERPRGAVVTFGAVALAVAGPLLPIRLNVMRDELAPYLPAMAAFFRAHPERASGPVYTNSPLLSSYLDGAGAVPGVDVRFLVGVDQYFDVVEMSNPANGQREALRHVIALDFYGHGVTPDALSPESVPRDATFALRVDRRLGLLLPEATWGARLEPLEEGRRYRIMRLARESAP